MVATPARPSRSTWNCFLFRQLFPEIAGEGHGMARKYSKGAQKKVEKAMHERKKGTLRSGPGGKGGKVKSRKQAIAIGLSEARKAGKTVPKRKTKKKKKS
ncbi:MAG TPA: DUF6496 domain-containing protein [Rhizomicrobium sp.]